LERGLFKKCCEINTDRDIGIVAMIKSLLKYIFRHRVECDNTIVELTQREKELIAKVRQYTMTNEARLWSFMQSVYHVNRLGLEGAIVECGVWKGGYLLLAGLMQQQETIARDIFGYDTFSGMSEPCDIDRKTGATNTAMVKWQQQQKESYVDWCYAEIEEVRRVWSQNVGGDNLRLVKGDVTQTLRDHSNVPEKIALLRLDTDFYESTMATLEVLIPRVVDKGIVIIDDYGSWEGCRRAVDEYFAGKNIWMHRVDRASRLIILEKEEL